LTMVRADAKLEPRDVARGGGIHKALCPFCGHRVSRSTAAEADYVRRMGCGCPRSPGVQPRAR